MARTVVAQKPFAVIADGVHAENYKGYEAVTGFVKGVSNISVNADCPDSCIKWYGTKTEADLHPARAAYLRIERTILIRNEVRKGRSIQAYAGKESDMVRWMELYTEATSPATIESGFKWLAMECAVTGLTPWAACLTIRARVVDLQDREQSRIVLRESIK